MSIAMFNASLNEIEKEARERALREGKSPEEAQRIAEQQRVASGSAVISALSRSTAWGLAGAAAGSFVPVVGTAIGGTLGFIGGAISALVDPKPSPGKAVKDYVSVFTTIHRLK